ncbi:MAG: response regulator transcription factor [Verrucomicrobiota bacterium]
MNRILLVEDLPGERTRLGAIAREAFVDVVVDEADTRRRALELCAGASHDLALVDLGLPDGSGVDVLRELRANRPDTICVVVTVMGDDASIVTALSAGAHGYLLKEQPDDVLVRLLRQINDGVPPLSPSVARRIMEHFRLTGPCECPEASKLTSRETEVLGLVARGLRIADAAVALGVAEGTVASHVKSIYRKLDIGSRAEAALHASRMGLL